MCNADRTVWITYNGEIYNFLNYATSCRTKGTGSSRTPTRKSLFISTRRKGRIASSA